MQTRILKWKDGKKGVFLLAFDDSCPSHVDNAVPELVKRGIPGTFYVNPGNGPWQARRQAWEGDIPGQPGIEYGNHTFWHRGATNAVQLDVELAKCAEAIDGCFPERKKPRLVSFGRPGGVPWTVTEDEKKAALAKYHLAERPPFYGPPFHVKTVPEMEAWVDGAIAKGEMRHLDFHGVGGDWHVASMEYFTALLDRLVANRDKLWLTDAVSYHQYAAERDGTTVEVLQSDATGVRLRLACPLDPALYDLPLTLETRVPAAWGLCRVTQGATTVDVAASEGTIRYDALPGGGEVAIRPLPDAARPTVDPSA
jgi:peptidoglycan/xylan/chitin deacetylase (PgdA/CDA1 family)